MAMATVSHVCAFCAPPWRNTYSGSLRAPHQRADLASVGELDGLAADGRRAVVGQPELFGVLVEQTELVVLDTLHGAPLHSTAVAQHQRWVSDDASLGSTVRYGAMRAPELDFRPTIPELLRRAVEQHGDADFVVSADRRCSFREAEQITRVLAKRMLVAGVGKGNQGRDRVPVGRRLDGGVARGRADRRGARCCSAARTGRPSSAARCGSATCHCCSRRARCSGTTTKRTSSRPSRARRRRAPVRSTCPSSPTCGRSGWWAASQRAWVTPVAFDAVDDTGLSDELLAAVESEVSPADPGVVVYTSGSAAEPKAVVHTHGTVVRKTSTGSMVGLPGSYPGQPRAVRDAVLLGGRRADAGGRAAQRLGDRVPGALRRRRRAPTSSNASA